jgi:hypothetical protein
MFLTILSIVLALIAFCFWKVDDYQKCSNKDAKIGWVFIVLSFCVWIVDLLM